MQCLSFYDFAFRDRCSAALLLCHLPDQCPILNLLIDLDSVRRSDFRMAAWLP